MSIAHQKPRGDFEQLSDIIAKIDYKTTKGVLGLYFSLTDSSILSMELLTKKQRDFYSLDAVFQSKTDVPEK